MQVFGNKLLQRLDVFGRCQFGFGGLRVVLHFEAKLFSPAAHVLVALALIDAPLDARIVKLKQVVKGDG
eukprot:2216554-Prymnesium_polylepis.1